MKRTLILLFLVTGITFIIISQKLGTNHNDINIAVLGDSNVWLGGDSCNDSRGWTAIFANYFRPKSIRSYARSGATWTNTQNTIKNTQENIEVLGDNNVIFNQVERLLESVNSGKDNIPDLIIISAGANDAWFYTERPKIFSQINKTVDYLPVSLLGSIKYNCQLLKRNLPNSTIVLMTPMQMTKCSEDKLRKVSDIIELAGNELGCIVIRTDIDGPISREQELKQFVNTYDGVHTSHQGAIKTAMFVIENLNLLLDY